MLLTVQTPTANILGNPQEPDKISNEDSQLLYGETFQVEKGHGAYVYGYNTLDGYKGFVERDQLIKNAPPANIAVQVRSTHLYREPDFKSRPAKRLSFLSRLSMTEETSNGFVKLQNGLWLFADHARALDGFQMPDDMAQTATLYLNTPYLFGGRSVFGIDCSGLIQQIMMAHGHPCPPRDTGDQTGAFGTKIERKDIRRNDIVFFKGHVGIMMDDKYILNATARHMSTVMEDLDDLEKIYEGITYIARI